MDDDHTSPLLDQFLGNGERSIPAHPATGIGPDAAALQRAAQIRAGILERDLGKLMQWNTADLMSWHMKAYELLTTTASDDTALDELDQTVARVIATRSRAASEAAESEQGGI